MPVLFVALWTVEVTVLVVMSVRKPLPEQENPVDETTCWGDAATENELTDPKLAVAGAAVQSARAGPAKANNETMAARTMHAQRRVARGRRGLIGM